jgi:hypothetical protein
LLEPHWAEPFKAGRLSFGSEVVRGAARLDSGTNEALLNLLADVGDAGDRATIVNLDDPVSKARLIPRGGGGVNCQRGVGVPPMLGRV